MIGPRHRSRGAGEAINLHDPRSPGRRVDCLWHDPAVSVRADRTTQLVVQHEAVSVVMRLKSCRGGLGLARVGERGGRTCYGLEHEQHGRKQRGAV